MKGKVDEQFLKYKIFEKGALLFEWRQTDESYLYTIL